MIARRLKLALLDAMTALRPPKFPAREKPLFLNFAFHVEHLADKALFEVILAFIGDFRAVTGVSPLAAILAWTNPLTQARARCHGCSEVEFARRVDRVAEHAEIAMHGHFFKECANPDQARSENARLFGSSAEAFTELDDAALVPIGPPNYDEPLVEGQFSRDLEWLRSRGHDPKIYAGGQWMMTAHLAGLLERNAFRADTTIRKRHTGALGDYLDDPDIPPRGRPFVLEPTKSIIEIQSLFYPTVHPSLHVRPLRELLATDPAGELFAVFPSHETEVAHFRPEIDRHVRFITRHCPGARWLAVTEMVGRASAHVAGLVL